MTEKWKKLARELADSVDTPGGLDPEWREAFAVVPRHQFVPEFVQSGDVWIRVADDPGHWLEHIYGDTNLITQTRLSGHDETSAQRPTSSSSMPSIMAWMLQQTGLRAGQTVLEIGTGTGYNAGLLCHRLRDHRVTSMDLDPELVSTARERLDSVGHTPALIAGDGATGHPDNAPYDAIIATAAVDHIPPAWIEQLKPGGRIVTDLRGEFSGAMTTLVKIGADKVEGRCHNFDAAFMPMRADVRYPLRDGPTTPLVMDRRKPLRGTTRTYVQLFSTSADLRFVAELQLGPIRAEMFTTADELVISATDESWATATLIADDAGLHTVQQAGPRRLWDSLEAAYSTWHRARRPTRNAFGVTATTDKSDQRVWMYGPDSSRSWPLPI